jgi:hypothetical protein
MFRAIPTIFVTGDYAPDLKKTRFQNDYPVQGVLCLAISNH